MSTFLHKSVLLVKVRLVTLRGLQLIQALGLCLSPTGKAPAESRKQQTSWRVSKGGHQGSGVSDEAIWETAGGTGEEMEGKLLSNTPALSCRRGEQSHSLGLGWRRQGQRPAPERQIRKPGLPGHQGQCSSLESSKQNLVTGLEPSASHT